MTVRSLTMTCPPWGAAAAAVKACLMWLASTGKVLWRVTRWTQEHRNLTVMESNSRLDWDVAVTRCTSLHQDSDQCKKSSSRRVNKGHHSKGKSRHGSNDAAHSSGTVNCGMRSHVGLPPSYTGPKACLCLLSFWSVSNMTDICVCVRETLMASFICTVLGCWPALKSSLPVGSGRVLGTNWLLKVSPFTWGARHWPANISHPDRKWSQRNRDHVRHPMLLFHSQPSTQCLFSDGMKCWIRPCSPDCSDPSVRWPRQLQGGTAVLDRPAMLWNRRTLTSLRPRCRRWPFSYTR